MKFGYFDDRNKEYVITTPQTPLPWINYLGSEDFFSLVSNTAGGLQPKGGMALAAATVRGLILTVSHQEQIGALYPQVLETLVRGACLELFA